jgi:hypothetical protein
MSLTTVRGIHSLIRIGQLYIPNKELMGRVVVVVTETLIIAFILWSCLSRTLLVNILYIQ